MKKDLTLLLFGLFFLGIGVYVTFFLTRGYATTTGVIERVELVENTDARETADSYRPYVRYSVDGAIYHAWAGDSSSFYKEGQQIKIFYNPANPEQIYGSPGFVSIAVMAVGAVCVVAWGAGRFKERRRGAASREE